MFPGLLANGGKNSVTHQETPISGILLLGICLSCASLRRIIDHLSGSLLLRFSSLSRCCFLISDLGSFLLLLRRLVLLESVVMGNAGTYSDVFFTHICRLLRNDDGETETAS